MPKAAFLCSECHAESTLRLVIPGDVGGKRYAVYECKTCKQIDMRLLSGVERVERSYGEPVAAMSRTG